MAIAWCALSCDKLLNAHKPRLISENEQLNHRRAAMCWFHFTDSDIRHCGLAALNYLRLGMALSTFLISFWSKLLGTFLSSPVLLSHIVTDLFLFVSSSFCPHATLKGNEIIRLNQIEFYSAGIYFQELFSSQPKRKRIFFLLYCLTNRFEVKAECAVKHLISLFCTKLFNQ